MAGFFKQIVLLSAVFCATSLVESRKIPSYLKVCSRNDPDINKCIANAVEALRPHLKDGIPEFDLPTLNPFKVQEAELNSGAQFNAKFKDIIILDADTFVIDTLKVTLAPKFKLEAKLKFPKLRILSNYEIDGRILFLQLKGSGKADGNFTDSVVDVVGEGERTLKRNKVFINVQDVKLHGHYGKPVFHFSNLFPNSPELTENYNKVINENIEEFIEEIRPAVNKVIIDILNTYVVRIFSKFSFDDLFPKEN